MDDKSQSSIFRKESLERLSSPEQLDQLMQVVNPKSWLPLASLGVLAMLAIIWSVFGRIPITAVGKGILVHPTESSNELIGLTYFENAEGIQPGMEMMLLPDGAAEDGGILARVKSVSPPFKTLEAARQNTALNADAPTEVIVELEQDSAHASSGQQSASGRANTTLSPGTTAIARITLAEKAPIVFIFPFLEVSQ